MSDTVWAVVADVYHTDPADTRDEFAYSLGMPVRVSRPSDVLLDQMPPDELATALRSDICAAVWEHQRQLNQSHTVITTINNVVVERSEDLTEE